MRLLIMHPWAGLPSRQDLYAKLQTRTGWDVEMVTCRRWIDDYGQPVVAAAGPAFEGKLVDIPVALSGNIPLHFFTSRLAPRLRAFRPELVYIYHEPYAAATFQMLRATRAVARDVPVGVRSAQNIAKRYPVPFRQTERYVYRHSDFAVVVSDNVASVMRQKGYQPPIAVIPMPVDTATFQPPEDFAGRIPDPSRPLHIGFVGRLVPEKGVDTALRALAALPGGTARLSVIGSGPDEGRLRDLTDSLGVTASLRWEGRLDREATAAAYRDIDILVVPSRPTARWKEQFGRVVIEAAAAGVASIVTRSGELPYLLEQIGAGWSVPEDDDGTELASVLTELVADRRMAQTAGLRARQSVTEKFSEEAVVESLAETFDAARERGRGRGG